MDSSFVLAVVVSYNGGDSIVDAVDALVEQVDHVLIVDNGSCDEALPVIERLASYEKVSVELLGKNCGIGAALNRGVKFAKRYGFQWLLTMDQDSVAGASMVSELLSSASKWDPLAIATPSWTLGEKSSNSDREVSYAITSGNLVPMWLFEAAGLYNEEYFIDAVDFEFCLRARALGVRIVKSGRAVMSHRLGRSLNKQILGVSWRYTEHSAARRYYIYRNHMYLLSQYGLAFPGFLFKRTIVLALYALELMVFDENRVANVKMMWKGVVDYFHGRQGPLVGGREE